MGLLLGFAMMRLKAGVRGVATPISTPARTACQAGFARSVRLLPVGSRPVVCLLLGLGCLVTTLPAQGEVAIEVRVSGIEGPEGTVGIALWDSSQGFPEEIAHARDSIYVSIDEGTARTVFAPLEVGTYAVTVFHDKNDNRRFDKNWIGMPREKWGVSNNARPRLRAPRFDEAHFEVGEGIQLVEIQIE